MAVLHCLFSFTAKAQTDFVIIDSVLIKGNHKTTSNVIFKEIDLHSGDTIGLEQLARKLKINEQRLQSISLFTHVSINVKNWNTEISTVNIEIVVQENWYIYPYIIFELADRNFNVWRKEQNYSFERVNYGLALNHINFTGNKDKLKFTFQHGFTRKYEVSYDYPYVSGKWGLSANVYYSENREISYKTVNNKPVFYKNPFEKKIFYQHRASINLQHRTSAIMYQNIRLEYISANVDSSISNELNPNYFTLGQNNIRYLLLNYDFKFDNTHYPLYPVGGHKVEFTARKEGLGIASTVNNLVFALSVENHATIGKRLIISNRVKGKINVLNNKLPYFLNSGLGYRNDDITGFQLFVLDGRNFFLWKNAVKFKLFDKDFNTFKKMPRQFRVMNAKMFFRFNFDYGYVSDPAYGNLNPFTNSHQYGYGPAIDIIVYNNLVISCEYGITKSGEKGIFYKGGLNF